MKAEKDSEAQQFHEQQEKEPQRRQHGTPNMSILMNISSHKRIIRWSTPQEPYHSESACCTSCPDGSRLPPSTTCPACPRAATISINTNKILHSTVEVVDPLSIKTLMGEVRQEHGNVTFKLATRLRANSTNGALTSTTSS
jgi:hypothetical protein